MKAIYETPPGFQHPQLQSAECNTSEEEGRSPAASTGGDDAKKRKTDSNQGGDGSSIEIVRRPRGRPPGSKNKPKPPLIITQESDRSTMQPHILEIPAGQDVIVAMNRFVRRKNIGLSVLTGNGSVVNVTFRQPSSSAHSSTTVTFHGRFDILSISATFLPPSATGDGPGECFAISLAAPQGQIVGGTVIGPLISASTVTIIAASFANPNFHRLLVEEEISGSVSADNNEGSSAHPPQQESCAMSIYSCHVPSDVIWAPAARQPLPPPF